MLAPSLGSGSATYWLPESQQAARITQLHELARKELLRAPAGSDRQRQWWHLSLNTVSTPTDADWLRSLLSGKRRIPGLKLEQDRRWEIVEAWARIPTQEWNAFRETLAAEKKRDTSEAGEKWALAVEAAIATPEAKEQVFSKAQAGDYKFSEMETAGGAFHWMGQESLIAPLEDRFFEALPGIIAQRDNEDAASFISGFFPVSCSQKTFDRLDQFLKTNRKLPTSVERTLLSIREETVRCIRLRGSSANP